MRTLVLALAASLAVARGPTVAETTDPTDATDSTDDTDDPGPAPDLTARGDARSVLDTGSSAVRDGCTLRWSRYSPDGQPGEVLVVLAHGFGRSQAQMAGWAEHLASWGAEVVTPDLCFAGPFNSDHPANGRSLADLATELADDRPVILAGHSAGGLAAWLAASELGGAVDGVLLLDPVDNQGVGSAAGGDVAAPTGGLLAEPSSCNADNNGVAMVADAADVQLFQLKGTDHCHFEDPTDGVCTALCRRGSTAEPEPARQTVLALTAGFVRWRGGLDERGQAYWTAGSDAQDGLPLSLVVP